MYLSLIFENGTSMYPNVTLRSLTSSALLLVWSSRWRRRRRHAPLHRIPSRPAEPPMPLPALARVASALWRGAAVGVRWRSRARSPWLEAAIGRRGRWRVAYSHCTYEGLPDEREDRYAFTSIPHWSVILSSELRLSSRLAAFTGHQLFLPCYPFPDLFFSLNSNNQYCRSSWENIVLFVSHSCMCGHH